MVGTQSSGYMYDGVSEGYNGGTIQQIQQNVSDHKGLTAAKPNIILLHAGTNDLVKHPGITFAPAAAPDRLQTFINWIFTQLPDAVILVAQIEEVYGNSTRTMAHRTFNKGVVSMVTDMVKEDKHVFLANNASWLTDTAADKEYFAKDGIHPNDAGYNVLAKGWYDALVKVRGIAGFIKTPADVDFNTAIFAPASTRLASTHPTSSGAHTSVPSSILYGYGNHPTSSGAHASIPSSVMYPPSSPSKSSTKAATGKASTHSEHPPVKTVTSTAHTTVTTSRAISTVPHTTLVYATVTEFVTATTKAPVRVRQLRNVSRPSNSLLPEF